MTKKDPSNMVKLGKILNDLCYRGCLDLIKIHFDLSSEVIASTRNRLTDAVKEVMNNYVMAANKADDRQQVFLECFVKFYWEPFESILKSFLRRANVEEKDDAFIRGEFENEKNRALEDAIASFQ